MSQDNLRPNYIAVEGVIGVGKTSFAKMLAERLEAELLAEEVFENPFLVDFYKHKKRHAFSCQLFFLLSRFQQQQQLMVRDLFAQRIVADYLFAKDAIFASVNLAERELALYDKIAPILSKDVPRPDLAIYLQASTPTLLQRIRKRNYTFEKTVGPDYVEMLNKAYDYYFFNYTETPLLVVKTDEIDFVENPEHFDDLIDQIEKPMSGKKYYVPAGNVVL
ncbi:MAG: deoxynucleoside kinase [candidate division Zixibacteria bacterium]|nr:deoxynucleoside kinase [candidate division Zixibacteria bacterium]MDH3936891.1 deoxynucleoside kinase [candidate division Zixibacteria bacterium]MDH4034738.1 deoxynucleoside kinase [candidate division Zixibacteria bacterium]